MRALNNVATKTFEEIKILTDLLNTKGVSAELVSLINEIIHFEFYDMFKHNIKKNTTPKITGSPVLHPESVKRKEGNEEDKN